MRRGLNFEMKSDDRNEVTLKGYVFNFFCKLLKHFQKYLQTHHEKHDFSIHLHNTLLQYTYTPTHEQLEHKKAEISLSGGSVSNIPLKKILTVYNF